MEKKYWIGRSRSASKMARSADSSEARLIHYELSGRYSIMAAQCPPGALPERARAPAGERAMLHLRAPSRVESSGPAGVDDLPRGSLRLRTAGDDA